MNADRFTLDTNVLIYSVDARAGPRHELAQQVVELAAYRDCWLTLQAVSEFCVAATRKGMVPPLDAAAQASDWLEVFPALPASASAVRAALASAASSRAAYWDALLVATAAEGGCAAVLTEDMADGTTLGGVRIVNPFGSDALSIGAARLLGMGG